MAVLLISLVSRCPSIWGISISVITRATFSDSSPSSGRAFRASHSSRPLGNIFKLTYPALCRQSSIILDRRMESSAIQMVSALRSRGPILSISSI